MGCASHLEVVELLGLEVTGKCNLRCKHCHTSRFNEPEMIKQELTLSDIRQLFGSIDVNKVLITGGEPFAREDIFDVLREIEKRKILIWTIFTNGTLITQDIASELAEIESVISVTIGLDGMSRESHESLRGGGFEKTLKAISFLNDHGFTLRIATMITRQNIGELLKMYDWLKSYDNIREWELGRPRRTGRFLINYPKFEVSYEAASELIVNIVKKHLKDENKTFRINTTDLFYNPNMIKNQKMYDLNESPCAYRRSVHIKPNGDALFCMMMGEVSYSMSFLGNVRQESLSHIWHIKRKEMLLNKIKIKDLKECPHCKYVPFCGGGCRAHALRLYGDINARDPNACFEMATFEKMYLPLLPRELQEYWHKSLRVN